MVEWKIDGFTYHLKKPLTSSELKTMEDGSGLLGKYIQDLLAGRQPDRDLLNKQSSYHLRMMEATVSNCFGITQEEMSDMKYGVLCDLFDNAVTYSKGWNRL